ncbi:hypothetical protein KR084_001779 [Drosophila pseudotakahashii]|nr:hypothetical protein KR084_001779 [Drosophila pseudotakahashii]
MEGLPQINNVNMDDDAGELNHREGEEDQGIGYPLLDVEELLRTDPNVNFPNELAHLEYRIQRARRVVDLCLGDASLHRSRRMSSYLSPYLCKVCYEYVRGGVITICGHLFCWTCLWPKVSNDKSPMCPRCLHRLILHEDIVPFHGEGPNAHPDDNEVLAQPDSVPRPTGLYLSDSKVPGWFMVNDPQDARELAHKEAIKERDLLSGALRLNKKHPRIGTQLRYMRWFQVGTILMILMWCIFALCTQLFLS